MLGRAGPPARPPFWCSALRRRAHHRARRQLHQLDVLQHDGVPLDDLHFWRCGRGSRFGDLRLWPEAWIRAVLDLASVTPDWGRDRCAVPVPSLLLIASADARVRSPVAQDGLKIDGATPCGVARDTNRPHRPQRRRRRRRPRYGGRGGGFLGLRLCWGWSAGRWCARQTPDEFGVVHPALDAALGAFDAGVATVEPGPGDFLVQSERPDDRRGCRGFAIHLQSVGAHVVHPWRLRPGNCCWLSRRCRRCTAEPPTEGLLYRRAASQRRHHAQRRSGACRLTAGTF
jgi:hypothetical protein